jgi:SAM-dependent methyltransferase
MSQRIPMPPFEFQTLVCGPGGEPRFNEVADGLRNLLNQHGMLAKGVSILDVGCGCGRLARNIIDLPIGSYTGFDRHKGMIDWCVEEISSRDQRFCFDYFDLKSAYVVRDGEAGSIDVEKFRFPYADASFDSVLLASVFTHMSPDETRRYLVELARVMKPGAKALISLFISPTDTLEVHDDGFNLFHSRPRLLADIGALPFDVALSGAASVGYEHNWYALTRRP